MVCATVVFCAEDTWLSSYFMVMKRFQSKVTWGDFQKAVIGGSFFINLWQ